MATPFVPRKREVLSNLSSAGLVGDGTAAPGQQFSDQSDTGFVNAEDLASANAGKGKSMLDAAGKDQIDSKADFTELNQLKNYDPNAFLSSKTTIGSSTGKKTAIDNAGNETETTTTTLTPTTVTAYNGLSTNDVSAKKANVDGLRTGLNDLNTTYSDSAEGVARRQVLSSDKLKKSIDGYNDKQAGFDSFLMELEGAAGAPNSAIANKRGAVSSLLTKFDGIDDTVAGLRKNVAAAEGQVGTVVGTPDSTEKTVITKNAAVLPPPPVITRTDYDPKKGGDAGGKGETRTTNPDGSYTIVTDSGVTINYNADGTIKGQIIDPKGVLS